MVAKKPKLREIPLATLRIGPGVCFITMSTGQPWGPLLDGAYQAGWVVLELDALVTGWANFTAETRSTQSGKPQPKSRRHGSEIDSSS